MIFCLNWFICLQKKFFGPSVKTSKKATMSKTRRPVADPIKLFCVFVTYSKNSLIVKLPSLTAKTKKC